jgi:hypothetical protein
MICFYQTTVWHWTKLDRDALKDGVIIDGIEFKRLHPTDRERFHLNGDVKMGHTIFNIVDMETGTIIKSACMDLRIPAWLSNDVVRLIRLEQFKKEQHENQKNKSALGSKDVSGGKKPEASVPSSGPEESPAGIQVGKPAGSGSR